MGSLECGTVEDKKYLNSLWQQVFQDSEDYVNRFFASYYQEGMVYTWKEDGVIVTVLYALPSLIKIPKRGEGKTAFIKAAYLYAIATDPKYRGRHYLEQMLPALKKQLGENTVLFLVPEKGVIPYYQSLGLLCKKSLTDSFVESPWSRQVITEDFLDRMVISNLRDAGTYRSIREQAFHEKPHVVWNEKEIAYAMKELLECGGQIYLVEIDQKEYLLAGYVEEETEEERKQKGGEKKQFDNPSKVFHIVEKTIPFTSDNVKIQEKLLTKLGFEKFRIDDLFYMIDTELETDLYLSLALND